MDIPNGGQIPHFDDYFGLTIKSIAGKRDLGGSSIGHYNPLHLLLPRSMPKRTDRWRPGFGCIQLSAINDTEEALSEDQKRWRFATGGTNA